MSESIVDRYLDRQGEFLQVAVTDYYRDFVLHTAQFNGQTREVSENAWKSIVELASQAEVFAVSQEITELLAGTAPSMPQYRLRREDLPCDDGCAWFDGGFLTPDAHDHDEVAVMLGWSAGEVGLVLTVYTDATDSRDYYHSQFVEMAESNEDRAGLTMSIGRFALSGWYVWLYGEEPLDVSEVPAVGASWVQVAAAFLRFIQEPYVDNRMVVGSRPARRRAARALKHVPHTRVVELRKRVTAHKPAGGEREYSHRWVVHGHWRNQWYPSLQEHRPRYIPDHVKGPEDKPLVIKDVVYRVDR